MATAWIKESDLKSEVGPGHRITVLAGGNISAYSPVKWSAEKVVACAANDADCIGMSLMDAAVILNDTIYVALSGPAIGAADTRIAAGDVVKPGGIGKIMSALTIGYAGATIEDNIGFGFANQPANDGVEIVSASALDTMPVDIYGTTNGGVVVVLERVVLNGTTFVPSVKTDWGVILGFEIPEGYPTAAGIITLREASGDATIKTLAAGTRQSGVVNIPTASQRCFNRTISAVVDGASTKTIGVVGTGFTAAVQREAIVLTGAVTKALINPFRTATKLLVGDLETARTVTIKTSTLLDSPMIALGTAVEAGAAGALVDFELRKDSSQKGMLFNATVASATITNTTAATTFSNTLCSIPANILKAGKLLRVKASGLVDAANATDTLAIALVIGSTTVMTLPALDITTADTFHLEFDFVPRAAPGATASCVGAGRYVFGVPASATPLHVLFPAANFATNGALECKLQATFSVADVGNQVTCHQFSVELVG